MKSDILRYKTEFTLEEVARLMAGVETETPENKEDVISALRILLKAVRACQLIVNAPDPTTEIPLVTAEGDYNCDSPWRLAFVTRQALEKWLTRDGLPLPTWLAPEAAPSAPLPARSGHSQAALLRIIAGLVVLLTEKSGSTYSKCVKPRGKLDRPSLHTAIMSALKGVKASTKGVSQSQFYEIFDKELQGNILKALYPED